MDSVFITELKAETIIGVYDWEREIKQTVCLDIEMAHNNRPAANADDINLALNYKAVGDAVVTHIQSATCELVETLAEEIAQLIQKEFGVPWLTLTLKKPGALPYSKDVGVKIERGEK